MPEVAAQYVRLKINPDTVSPPTNSFNSSGPTESAVLVLPLSLSSPKLSSCLGVAVDLPMHLTVLSPEMNGDSWEIVLSPLGVHLGFTILLSG